MKEEDKFKFAELITAMAGNFNKAMDKPTMRLWWEVLKPLPIDAFESACRRAIIELEWMPKPAHIFKLAGGVTTSQRATLAWSKILSNMNAYQSVDFGDPVIHAAIRMMGGWEELCRKDKDWLNNWGLKEFEKIYIALYDGPQIGEREGAYLAGQADRQNSAMGFFEQCRVKHIDTGLPPSRHPPVKLIDGKPERKALPPGCEKIGELKVENVGKYWEENDNEKK